MSRMFGSLAAGAVFMGTQGMNWIESVLICGLFAGLGSVALMFENRRGQRTRDAEARAVVEDVSRDFVLYLRPFQLTNTVPLSNPGYIAGAAVTSAGYEPQSLDFETMMENVARPDLPVIALGRPGEAIGVGRVAVSDQEWWDAFLDLSARARALIIVPGSRSGIVREFQSLKERRILAKCLFVLPGALRAHEAWDWGEARDAISTAIPELPKKPDGYTTFKLDEDGDIREMQSTSGDLVSHLSMRIKAILKNEEVPPVPESASPAREPLERWLLIGFVGSVVLLVFLIFIFAIIG